ncbi:MAG: hypothetical protein WBB22_08455 [Anaerolineae bacterium]
MIASPYYGVAGAGQVFWSAKAGGLSVAFGAIGGPSGLPAGSREICQLGLTLSLSVSILCGLTIWVAMVTSDQRRPI